MLKRRGADLNEYVWEAASRLGMSAPRITNDVIERLFPETCAAASDEGAFSMFRQGVLSAITTILRKSAPANSSQIDLSEISEEFRSIVADLKSRAYFVEALGEQVAIETLIEQPELLDDARKFMRRKSVECAEEAKRLDKLYAAVIAQEAAQ
jgi:hypothetical protein